MTPLDQLLHEIDTVVHGSGEPSRVAATLQRHLGDPDLLAPEHRASSADGYRTNVVHVAPDGAFSLVALVWRPGQRTPVHSHRSWCVVGVHEGAEVERSYTRVDGSLLHLTETRRYEPGAVTWLSSPEEIHDVANAGDSIAISLHVYGLDYRRLGSSILETFDLPVAETVGAG